MASTSNAAVLVGIVAIALSLRGPITAVTPVIEEVSGDLALSAGTAGLLGTLPVLLFAITSPLAALVIRRVGPELAVLLCLGGVFAGQLVRAVPNPVALISGTAALGLAIVLGNIVVPVIIRRDVQPDRVGVVTGAYAATLNFGSLVTVSATAPLAHAWGWPRALASWALLGAAAFLTCLVLQRRRRARDAGTTAASGVRPEFEHDAASQPRPRSRPVTRMRVTWLLSAAFAAQAFAYYGYTTWLPAYLVARAGANAASAGAVAATFQAWGIVGGFLIPTLLRTWSLRQVSAAVGALWIVTSVGALTAPEMLPIWLLAGGLAQAGGFTAVFSAVPQLTHDAREAAGMSATVQTLGYTVAAASGPALGAMRDHFGSWMPPMVTLVCATVIFTFFITLATGHVARSAVR